MKHKSIENTMVYIHLEKATFGSIRSNDYYAKIDKTAEEACKLGKSDSNISQENTATMEKSSGNVNDISEILEA